MADKTVFLTFLQGNLFVSHQEVLMTKTAKHPITIQIMAKMNNVSAFSENCSTARGNVKEFPLNFLTRRKDLTVHPKFYEIVENNSSLRGGGC